MGAVPSAVSVLTVVDPTGVDHGMTVSAFCSLSLDPPLVLACVGDDATIATPMREATRFGISVLAADQEALSRRFADRDVRSFVDVPHARGPGGTALFDGATAHLECVVTTRHTGGDHTIVVGAVAYAVDLGRPPLIHHRRGYTRPDPGPPAAE
jgi:flavin reductase (DIM6/NTAB) family NADH-FMN oxidoreductase RutF